MPHLWSINNHEKSIVFNGPDMGHFTLRRVKIRIKLGLLPMPQAKKYQNNIFELLKKHFESELVKKEWDISKDATDVFRHRPAIYAPRLDIAVGPFNTGRDNSDIYKKKIFSYTKHRLIKKLLAEIDPQLLNKNPRCLLAVEISFNGTSKHFMGDLINASMMGLIGIVIANDENYNKMSRISKYITILQGLEKLPFNLCGNVKIFSTKEFVNFLK